MKRNMIQQCGKTLKEVLLNNKGLEELNLHKNKLTSNDMDLIVEGLQRNNKLKLIDLSENEFN
jgi:Ran GTPase-activating protein (RanGAP) involved in mRNA processing and transport